MKKLLNLFAGITLVATTASTVVACDNNKNDPKTQNTATVNDIVNKLNNFLKSNPIIKIDSKYTNLKDPATIVALNNALASQGLQLKGNPGDPTDASNKPTGEWADLTYSGTLTAFEETSLTVNIKAGEGSSMVTKDVSGLKVQNATDPEAASNLKTAITEGFPMTQPIILPSTVGSDANNEQTILNTELDSILQNNNVNLKGSPGSTNTNPTKDWSHISYEGTIPGTIKIIITFGTQKEVINNVKVVKAQTNQQQAQALAGKIIQKNVIVPPNTNTDVTLPATKAVLDAELKTANPALEGNPGDGTTANPPTGDFSHITYKGTLRAKQTTTLNAVVKFAQTPSKTYGNPYTETINDVHAILGGTNQEILDSLAGEIDQTKTLALPYGKNYDPTNATDATTIFNALNSANPLFHLPHNITKNFSNDLVNMENAQPTTVNMTLTLGTATNVVPLAVGVNNIWKQTSFPTNRGAVVRPRESKASYSGVDFGTWKYYASNNGLLATNATTPTSASDWSLVSEINRQRVGGTGVVPSIVKPPVAIDGYDYVTLQGKSSKTPGVFRSVHDKNQWTPVSSIGLDQTFQAQPVRFNFGTATNPEYKYFLMSSAGGGVGHLWTSSDGVNWTQVDPTGATIGNIGSAENAPSKIGDTLYQGTYKQGLWEGTNKGNSWAKASGIPTNGWINYPPAQFGDGNPFVYVEDDANTIQSGVYYRNSETGSWTKSTTSGIFAGVDFKSKPVKIGNKIYWQSDNKGLWMSDDNGATWSQIDSNTLSGTGGQVSQIVSMLYLGTNDGLYTSSDGVTWTKNPTGTFNASTIVPGPINKIGGSYQAATKNNGPWYI